MNLELFPLLVFLLISIALSTIRSILFILSERDPDKEKVLVYECGLDPFHNPGEPSFLIAILFLVFDLEISYLFP